MVLHCIHVKMDKFIKNKDIYNEKNVSNRFYKIFYNHSNKIKVQTDADRKLKLNKSKRKRCCNVILIA